MDELRAPDDWSVAIGPRCNWMDFKLFGVAMYVVLTWNGQQNGQERTKERFGTDSGTVWNGVLERTTAVQNGLVM